MSTEIHVVVESPCPSCGVQANRAMGLAEGGEPTPGDITLCSACGALLTFTNSMERVHLPPEEFEKLPSELKKWLVAVQKDLRNVEARLAS